MGNKLLSNYASLAEVAAQIGCHPRTVKRWAARGILSAVRIHSKLMLIDVRASRAAILRATRPITKPLVNGRRPRKK